MSSDPSRLLEQNGDSFEQRLLDSANIDVGSDRARAACLAAVTSSAVVTGGAAAAEGAIGASTKGFWLAKWLAVVALVGGGVAVITWPSKRSEPETAEVLAPAVQPRSRASTPLLPSQSVATAPAQSASAVLANPRPRSAQPAQQSLREELRLLDRARASLQQGNATSALDALDQRDREHPQGVLGPEATVLRVQALLALGRRGQAERVAHPWLSRTGPHADRLRGLLGVENP